MIVATIDWKILTIAAILLLVAMILLFRLLSRDPDVSRTRYGFFIERDRYDQEEGWPHLAPPEQRTLPGWRDKTAELPAEDDKQ